MAVIYYDADADPAVLTGKTIGVIGYNTQGATLTYRLQQDNYTVIVSGLPDDIEQANEDGFTTAPVDVLAQQADILWLLLPDEVITGVYMQSISPHLRREMTLIFVSAYSIAFGFIEPPPFVDVGLISPRTPLIENGTVSFVGVWQDASHQAWDTILALTQAIGSLRIGAVEVNIEQEAELSLFIQQTIVPALHNIMLTAADLLMNQGYPTEAVLTDLYLSGKFQSYMGRMLDHGLLHALEQTPLTEQYGVFTRMDRFNDLKMERLMEVALEEIRSGQFAQEWAEEYADGYPRLEKLRRRQRELELRELEQQTLEFFDSSGNL